MCQHTQHQIKRYEAGGHNAMSLCFTALCAKSVLAVMENQGSQCKEPKLVCRNVFQSEM